MPSIAIVGMACRFPDASSPSDLWQNVLARRRAFRRIPRERLRLEDYYSADPARTDTTYLQKAALIEGYEFDRMHFRVSSSTFRSVDLAHWLALDIAARALADAGFPDGERLPHESTGVLVGNSLTGEFSRASTLRLRWPFVRRVAENALAREGVAGRKRHSILTQLESEYLKPFSPTTEESLAGGLANVIAGRICNHFNLRGGGYTLDGACASSLLAVISAATALESGDLDVALAGGVDLSLDPFELVGFSRVGAFARDEMRVFDRRSGGFLPGEGCGFVVLMRHEDAVRQGRRIYAILRGWGVSSDGAGGITRPEVEGQLLALRRAYQRAGFGIDTVTYFEGHGTGTPVGDLTEIQALARARSERIADCGLRIADCSSDERTMSAHEANPKSEIRNPQCFIGSVKANIGHTKAAAGVAGLIKAIMALDQQLLPPTTGCETPHPELAGNPSAPAVLDRPMPWPADRPRRAGVSSMGFGGINTHIVVESPGPARRTGVSPAESATARTQDAEVLCLSAADRNDLLARLDAISLLAPRLSQAELTDLAAQLSGTLESGPARAAIVAGTPEELAQRVELARSILRGGQNRHLDTGSGVFIACPVAGGSNGRAGRLPPRLSFLFPGQGGSPPADAGALERRFGFVRTLFDPRTPNATDDEWPNPARVPASVPDQPFLGEIVQPATVRASLAGLGALAHLGIEASHAAGHSLGELVALHWAGAIDEDALLRIAAARGRAMDRAGRPGAMAAIGAEAEQVRELIAGVGASWPADAPAPTLCLACLNSPQQTVVSGDRAAIDELVRRAGARGLTASVLQTTHAFHSPLIADAVPVLDKQLEGISFVPLHRTVVSTVTGGVLDPQADLRDLLCRQVVSPVLFSTAAHALVADTDLFIEVGAGEVLNRLIAAHSRVPVISLEVGGTSLRGLLHAVGAAFVLGLPVQVSRLFADRFCRPFDLDRPLRFFANPCESVADDPLPIAAMPDDDPEIEEPKVDTPAAGAASDHRQPAIDKRQSALDVLRQVLEERLELPAQSIRESDHLLRDLHLNSISVGQIIAESARRLGLPRPSSPTEFAQATVGQAAGSLDQLRGTAPSARQTEPARIPPGVDTWVRAFTVDWQKCPRQPSTREHRSPEGTWSVTAPPGHPLAAGLASAFAHAPGGGAIVCLPADPDEQCIPLLLEGVRRVLGAPGAASFVLVQQDGGAAAFARSLCLEAPELNICVVDVPFTHPEAATWVLEEAASAGGYGEARYDAQGCRYEPRLRVLSESDHPGPLPLSRGDVLLVTGGGKGIAAECALALARDSGARLGILGRSSPASDAELSANLERLAAAGVRFHYATADVLDAAAVTRGIAVIERELGPITAVLHGAGNNTPRLIRDLDEPAFLRTLAPKVQGLRNVLAGLDAGRLRLLITFGSLISRTGFRGEADYAVANEWLGRLTRRFGDGHPGCRCLCLDWSIWSGVGMGERLGRVGALLEEGITPITPDQGVAVLRRLLRESAAPCVIVSGRMGAPPTLRLDAPALPRGRFLEDQRVYYPGVELVVDSRLSNGSDPYMNDHVLGADRLFPAVMGLEAMAQAAGALTVCDRLPAFEHVEFLRPVIVPEDQVTTLRVAALVRQPGCVEVVLRTSQTDFQIDHFRATCRFDLSVAEGGWPVADRATTPKPQPNSPSEIRNPGFAGDPDAGRLPLLPARDLYGEHLFQKGRFQRLEGYRQLSAARCLADIAGNGTIEWFASPHPAERRLGDPGVRDAALHAVQACIPHKVVLPVSVDRIRIACPARGPCRVRAVERQRRGDLFIYDLDLLDSDGTVVESWLGLHLKATQPLKKHTSWSPPLLRPYLERELFRVFNGRYLDVVIGQTGARDSDQADALKREFLSTQVAEPCPTAAAGSAAPVTYRPDGKPEPASTRDRSVTFAYGEGLLLGVSGEGLLGCDLEPVVSRAPSDWEALLGSPGCRLAQQMCQITGDGFDTAATRVWTVLESMKKAGLPPDTPLTLRTHPARRNGSARPVEPHIISVGAARAAAYLLQVQGHEHPLIATVLSKPLASPREAARPGRLDDSSRSPKAYEYRHVVTFEDTNLLGNVYYVNYLSWQGRCRELFLREHAPGVLAQLRQDLRLVTVRVSCRFAVEVAAFDELLIRMSLKARKGNRLKLAFEYLRVENGRPVTVARGVQVVACMRRDGDHLVHTDVPTELLEALKPYAGHCEWEE